MQEKKIVENICELSLGYAEADTISPLYEKSHNQY